MKTVNDVCKELDRVRNMIDKIESSDRIMIEEGIYFDQLVEVLENYRDMLFALPIKN